MARAKWVREKVIASSLGGNLPAVMDSRQPFHYTSPSVIFAGVGASCANGHTPTYGVFFGDMVNKSDKYVMSLEPGDKVTLRIGQVAKGSNLVERYLDIKKTGSDGNEVGLRVGPNVIRFGTGR
jgi:hypothetical protein